MPHVRYIVVNSAITGYPYAVWDTVREVEYSFHRSWGAAVQATREANGFS